MVRFTIRDVLWLTVVVALGVAWGVSNSRWRAEESRWREEVRVDRDKIAGLIQVASVAEARSEYLSREFQKLGWTVEWDADGPRSVHHPLNHP